MFLVKRIFLKIFVFALIIFISILAFYNNTSVPIALPFLSITQAPLFLIMFMCGIVGSLINFIVFLLYKK